MPGASHDLADVVFRVGRAYGMTADRNSYRAAPPGFPRRGNSDDQLERQDRRLPAVGQLELVVGQRNALATGPPVDPQLP